MSGVLASHPHTALFAQHAAAGLDGRDLLHAFVSGMAWPASLVPGPVVSALRSNAPLVLNRLLPRVRASRVVPLALGELVARAGTRLRARPRADMQWYDVMFTVHDELVSRLPWGDARAVLAYEDAALRTFTRARPRGMACLYDLPIPYHRELARMRGEENARHPGAQVASSWREPAWKERRKDGELALADLVICASAFTRASLDQAPAPPRATAVVPYGFPVDEFEPRAVPPDGPFTVLAVGSQDLRKGTPYLLQAWKAAGLKDARLRIIGGMRLERSWVGAMGVSFEHVEAMPRALLADEYARADLLAFPTLGDGFGLVMQEAMACGTPVVTTRCGGGPECITHGEDGYLVKEASVDELVTVFRAAAADRGALFEMGKRARSRAERWTWLDYERAYGDVVAAFLDGAPAPSVERRA